VSLSRRGKLTLWAGLALVALLTTSVPVAATPVCPDEPRAACGGRIFPEAENAVAFVQHDSGEYADGIAALARDFPRFVKVRTFSDVLGREALSFGGREMRLVEITDFEAPEEDKIPVVVSMSVHGPERAGLEGGVRYMEDLARWAEENRDRVLRNGTEKDSIGVPVRDVLERVHLYLADANPDGWAEGDTQNGGVFMRGNGNGVDLNREFPTIGWSYPPYTALSEPESIAWAEIVRGIDPVITSDMHGELTSAQDAFADMMYPVGQWDPLMQARQERLARHMKSNVDRYFEEKGVEAQQVSGFAGMKPAEYATGFDVVGYDDAGFMGDWFTQEFGAVDMDVEHFFSHMAPNSTWAAPLEEAHIEAVRGEIEAMIVEATVTHDIKVKMKVGRVGYLSDPRVVKMSDGYGGGDVPEDVEPQAYSATRMQYFKDMSRYTTSRVRPVTVKRLSAAKLRRFDSFVVADGFRELTKRRAAVLHQWVRRGGNLILTDQALQVVAKMGLVKKRAVKKTLMGAGHIDIHQWDDLYVKGVHPTASQTYYEVPLGFTVDSDSSPHWTIARSAWRKARGKSAAHLEEENRIILGRAKLGKGRIGIFGAVLPQPTEKYEHFYGLADYAVSVAGGQILNNMFKAGVR